MPAKLSKKDKTASIQLMIPSALKNKALKIAKKSHDGNLSKLVRALIENAWSAFKK